MQLTRRLFLKLLAIVTTLFSLSSIFRNTGSPKSAFSNVLNKSSNHIPNSSRTHNNLGLSKDGFSHVYISHNGTPEQNVFKVIEMMGGIKDFINDEDIIIIKPNAQWTGHATTNTNAIKGFIDLVLSISTFKGEIIIAENHHYHPGNNRGWTTTNKNGDFNLNELVDHYHSKGFPHVTKYHWRDARSNSQLTHSTVHSRGTISAPEEGDGYVWTDEDYIFNGLKTKMTYPIFTSKYSKVTIDLKNGAWKDGHYTGQPVKLINFSALNHHGNAGITAATKNYMGIVDLTCGFNGSTPTGYYNFHYIGFSWPQSNTLRRLIEKCLSSNTLRKNKYTSRFVSFPGPKTGALGGAIGHFMKTIRMADLNIIAAEYVGHESRWSNPIHAKTVLASTDPVALDYYAAKHIVLPLGGEKSTYHDPDNSDNTLCKILQTCNRQGIGTLNEKEMVIHKYNFS